MDLGANLEALDRDLDVVRNVSSLDGQLHGVLLDRDNGLDGSDAHEVDGHINVHLLAFTDDDEVNVLDDRPDRVALDVLGQSQVVLAVDLDGEQDVGDLEGQHRLVARQADVDRLGAVTVHDGGDLVFAPDAAGGALTELGAGRGDELALGHWGFSYVAERIRAPLVAAYTGVLVCHRSAVGLNAGRGTKPETGVASAVHPVNIRASGATASITDHYSKLVLANQLQSCSVPRRGNSRSLGDLAGHRKSWVDPGATGRAGWSVGRFEQA